MRIKKFIRSLPSNYISISDILANGVAVIMIVIIVSLSIIQEKAKKEAETLSEAGAVMSRDFAKNLVSNDLPSSAPATLHNYNHPRRNRSPLIEFHNNILFVLDQGPGTNTLNWKLTKNHLLEKPNLLDKFLDSLPNFSKKNIRANIFDTDMYYIVMDILNDHDADIRDWHFMKKGEASYLDRAKDSKPIESDLTKLDKNQKQKPKNQSMDNLDEKNDGKGKDSKFDSDLLPEGIDLSELPIGELPEGLPSSSNLTPEERLKELKNLLDRGILNFNGNQSEIIIGGESPSRQGSQSNQKNQKSLKDYFDPNKPFNEQMLHLILNYLIYIQEQYENNKFFDLSTKDLLAKLESIAFISENTKYKDDVKKITSYIKKETPKIQPKIAITQEDSPLVIASIRNISEESVKIEQKATIRLQANEIVKKAIFNNDDDDSNLLDKNYVSVLIYPQPTFLNGSPRLINTNDIFLIPYKNILQDQRNWYAIAFADPNLKKINLGFVYGTVQGTQIYVSNLENHLKINYANQRISYQADTNYFQLLKISIIIFILLGFLTLFLRLKK